MADDCATVEPLLSAWTDGELTETETGRVGRHLAACARCAGDAEALSEVSSLLRSNPVRRPPAAFPDPSFGAVAEPPPVTRRVRVLVATGLVVGVALSLGAGESEQTHFPTPLDAFVADQFGAGHTNPARMMPVLLDTRP